MTEGSFNRAKDILKRLEYIRTLKRFTYHNPCIKDSNDKSDYIYLSWADSEHGDLKKLISNWCNEEEKKLLDEFGKL